MSSKECRNEEQWPVKLIRDVEAARIAGVSVATWRRMVFAGNAPQPIRLSAACVRWKVEDLERFPLRSLQIPTRLEEVDAGLGGDGLLDVSNGFD